MRRKLTAAVTRLLAFLLGGAAAVTPAIGLALALLPEIHKVLPYLDWRDLRLVACVLGWLLLWFVVGLGVAALLGQRLPRLRCVAWFWCGVLTGTTAGITLLPMHRPEFAVGITFACGVIAGLLSIRTPVRVGPDAGAHDHCAP